MKDNLFKYELGLDGVGISKLSFFFQELHSNIWVNSLGSEYGITFNPVFIVYEMSI